MTALARALGILRTQGLRHLWKRSWGRVLREIRSRSQTYIQEARWTFVLACGRLCRPVHIAVQEMPLVSIVIPLSGHVKNTAACLNSIAADIDPSIPFEIIVVDDASRDETASYLTSCSGLRVIRHEERLGFGASANDGARVSRGRFIHFLNNDTLVTAGWLAPLVQVFVQHPDAGAVGSKLCYIDRTLAEAGSIVWRDGNATNYGKGSSASLSDYNYVREVDYSSAASLMVSKAAFIRAGGFDARYSPAYYEDVDLCFTLRSNKMRVFYQPASLVIHFEGRTAGKRLRRGIKRFQLLHRETFTGRWSTVLPNLYVASSANLEPAARRLQGPSILFIDGAVPFYDRDAGSDRAFRLMRIMRALGYHVVFVGEDGTGYEPYCYTLRQLGVEVRLHSGDGSKTLKRLPITPVLAWICRPALAEKYMPMVERLGIPAIYDTVDLHYLRMRRSEPYEKVAQRWQEMREVELGAARRAAAVVTTSSCDAKELGNAGIRSDVIPIIAEIRRTPVPSFEQRSGLLFLGNYSHAPNLDAAMWLCDVIMPIVWESLPQLVLTFAGADIHKDIASRACERVVIRGYVADIEPLFDAARVLVAPLRFGAGMKGKVIQSLANGLPVVTSTIGAEGTDLINGLDACIEDSPGSFASAVIRLCQDRAYWTAIAVASQCAARRYTPEAVTPAIAECLHRVWQTE